MTFEWSGAHKSALHLNRGAGALLVMGVAGVVFGRTAYPTITWWDSAQYSLAAGTLGITGPPGSLLLTLLGWPIARLPFGSSPAHLLNLFAGALAAVVVGLVYRISLRMLRATSGSDGDGGRNGAAWGAALGALTFAFTDTLWQYATRFTPYVLSAVSTALILWAMLRWWEDADRPDAWRRLAVLGLLFGLDFSVHRTNALLLPGALVWILLRKPRTLRTPQAMLGGAAGLVVGLALQLLIIPIAALTRSPLFWNEPNNWSRFWDYVSLKTLGGGFLIQFFPRKAGFWSVQVADLLHVLGVDFFRWNGWTSVLGVAPAGAALLGLAMLWRRNRRLGTAIMLVLFLQAAMTVLFFNIPASFFRTFDRHYLPVCVTIAVLVAYGLATAAQAAAHLLTRRMGVAAVMVVTLAVLVPSAQLIGNWGAADASDRYFARDFATNVLESLPPDAIFFTVGDNDTFPLLYFQAVEGVRRDVTIINLSVATDPDFAEHLRRREPRFPLALTRAERDAAGRREWTPTTMAIPVTGTAEHLGLAAGSRVPDSITVVVKPQGGTQMYPDDINLLDIVRTNQWRRPLTFSITGTSGSMRWLERYGRLEGLYWRIVPTIDPTPDVLRLRANLLEHAEYRGYADPTVRIDSESRTIARLYYTVFEELLGAEHERGDESHCRSEAGALFAALPPGRLALPPADLARTTSVCKAGR